MIETTNAYDPAEPSVAKQLATRLRDQHVATVLEYVDELAPTVDVARKARVRLAGSYGLAQASTEDVRTVVDDLTRPDPQELAP